MSLATSNRDGGRTSESGHLRAIQKVITGEVLTGLNVSQRSAGANMSVDVAIGDAIIPRADGTYGHPAWNDAVYNKVIGTADVSNPRRDIVVMYIDYSVTPSTGVSNNTNGVVKISVVAGTPAGSPVDPSDAAIQSAVGASNPFIKLARVRVAAGATSITNSVIDDLRLMARSKMPVGMVIDVAGATAPLGTLLLYGQAISRTTYADLFAYLGTTYGAGDGSTTFNLPDARGRVVAGRDDMGGSSANRLTAQPGGLNGDTLGATGGAETHTLTTAQIPAHSHGVGVEVSGGAGGWTTPLGGNGAPNNTYPSNAEGGGGAHNNVQPTIIFNKAIAY